MSERLVRVAIPRPIDGPLTWSVPATLPDLSLGHAVSVPFGAGLETGWVLGAGELGELDPAKLKAVHRLLDPVPVFDEGQLGFFAWIADYYLVPLGMVLRTALPSQIAGRARRVIGASETAGAALAAGSVSEQDAAVLRELLGARGLTPTGITRRLEGEVEAKEVGASLRRLAKAGLVATSLREAPRAGDRVATVRLVVDPEEARRRVGRSPRALAAIDVLAGGTLDVEAVVAALGVAGRTALSRLASLGLVERDSRERLDDLDLGGILPSARPTLNPAQRRAVDTVAADREGRTWMLRGVTGSGKTEVFLHVAEAALAAGREVLVLVPEIGLTPQLVGRFRARFGARVAVLHSGLTGAERIRMWRRVRAGEASVVVGARSALFAPFRRLGLIVVDEEHDDLYKQDDGVPYHARDLAVVLGRRHGCPVVLASASPSLETWYNAREGRYGTLTLPERATPRPLPEIVLVDLASYPVDDDHPRPILLPEAEAALRDAVDHGGQAVVLYNRRGFATLVECGGCGGAYTCPNCGISLTLHQRSAEMVCHWCALRLPYDGHCPRCGKEELTELGKGTERIEEVVRALWSDVEVRRMDADSTAARGAHARILERFRDGRTKVLVGTQMLAKGHDFPDVRTVVIVSADQPLRLPDFRAAERTFALLLQASGRAGRGEAPGKVIVQTWRPDHVAITSVSDPARFYAAELKIRATLRYPPFTRLTLLRLDGTDRAAVRDAAEREARRLRGLARGHAGVEVLGPAPSSSPRVAGRWRYQVVVRGDRLGPFREVLRLARPGWTAPIRGVRLRWDVDPRDLS